MSDGKNMEMGEGLGYLRNLEAPASLTEQGYESAVIEQCGPVFASLKYLYPEGWQGAMAELVIALTGGGPKNGPYVAEKLGIAFNDLIPGEKTKSLAEEITIPRTPLGWNKRDLSITPRDPTLKRYESDQYPQEWKIKWLKAVRKMVAGRKEGGDVNYQKVAGVVEEIVGMLAESEESSTNPQAIKDSMGKVVRGLKELVEHNGGGLTFTEGGEIGQFLSQTENSS